jgi:hypothetical protein
MKYLEQREEIYNEVIQDYSEVRHLNCCEDDKQNIIDNIVDLIENYGNDVYKVINLNDYELHHLVDYEYLETQMINHIENTN